MEVSGLWEVVISEIQPL